MAESDAETVAADLVVVIDSSDEETPWNPYHHSAAGIAAAAAADAAQRARCPPQLVRSLATGARDRSRTPTVIGLPVLPVVTELPASGSGSITSGRASTATSSPRAGHALPSSVVTGQFSDKGNIMLAIGLQPDQRASPYGQAHPFGPTL